MLATALYATAWKSVLKTPSELWAFPPETEREGNEPRVNRKREGKTVRRPCVYRLQGRQASTGLDFGGPEF